MEMDKFISLGLLLAYIALGAFSVTGLIEGGKSIIASIKAGTKIWIATVASFALSMVLSIAVSFMGCSPIQVTGVLSVVLATIWLGSLMFAFIEIIGYNMLIKTAFALFDALTAWAQRKLGDPMDLPHTVVKGEKINAEGIKGPLPVETVISGAADTPDAENRPASTDGGK